MNYKPILIVAGEPYSVFLEILFKSLKNRNYKKPIILIVSKKLLLMQMKKLNYSFQLNSLDKTNFNSKKLNNKKLNIIDIDFKFKKTFDKISEKSNFYIEKSFQVAIEIMKKNGCSGLINGPISKKNFLKGKFLGITEYLARKTNKNNIAMLIFNKKLSVSPITTHLPLSKVHKNISIKKIVTHVLLVKNFYKKHLKEEPKIAITGLNPHCESNFKFSEEDKIIIPAIKILNKKKCKIKGPFPADTVFLKDISKKYNVIIGMYHDQVLAPMKTIFNFKAINITLGLPFIRISPDHGPNSSMLGKNISNPESLIEAIKFLENK